MGIISMLKSALGVGGERSRDEGTPVAVEREPAAASERAVKGVDESPDTTGSTDVEDPPTPGGDAPEPTVERDAPAGDDAGEPVDAIKGIGSAYADRLADAGVHSVADLAGADADALAAETGLGAGRIANWIEQARARSR